MTLVLVLRSSSSRNQALNAALATKDIKIAELMAADTIRDEQLAQTTERYRNLV